MRKAHFNKIARVLSKTWEGYTLQEVTDTSEPNVYRGVIKKPSGTVAPDTQIIIRDGQDNTAIAHVINYAEGDDAVFINLSTGQLSKGGDLKLVDEEEQAKKYAAKLKELRSNLPKSREPVDSAFLKRKGIKLFGKAYFTDKKSWYTQDGSIVNPIAVPFYNSRKEFDNDEPCGMQIIGQSKDGKSLKTSVTGSQMTEALHILQPGKPDEIFQTYDGFICESYTTACEIAEAMPDNFVACCAGITNLSRVYNKLTQDSYNLIYVLDKVKSGKVVPKAEKHIKKSGNPFIQLCMFNPRLRELTDFNDFAMKFGKKAVKKEVFLQSYKFFTVVPEALSYEPDVGFKVLNPITQTVDTLHKGKLGRYLNSMSSASTGNRLFQSMSLSNREGSWELTPYSVERLFNHLSNEVSRAKMVQPRGLGLFKDGDGYILNLSDNDRYALIKKDGKWDIEYTGKIRPFGENRYINSTLGIGIDIATNPEIMYSKMTGKDFKTLFKLWSDCYDMDKSVFLLLLGFMVQGCYTSFSKCRPHAWLRGPTNCGKSYLINSILAKLVGCLTFRFTDSSKSGIEQIVAGNDVFNTPVILGDELGLDTDYKYKKVMDLIMMSREIFMGGLTPSYRGTKDQVAKVYYRSFSMMLASVTDGLRDHQDIGRFLMFDIDKFKVEGDGYETFAKEFEKLSGPFLNAVIRGAPYFDKFSSMINKELLSIYDRSSSGLAHKIASLTSCLAGVACLHKAVYGLTDTATVKKVMRTCQTAIRQQVMAHLDKVEQQPDFIDTLRRTYFKVGLNQGRLCDICEEEKGSEMWESYGVRLRVGKKENHGYYNLIVDKSKYRLGELLENRRQIEGNPIFDSLSKLHELKTNGKIKESVENSKRQFIIPRFCKVEEEE